MGERSRIALFAMISLAGCLSPELAGHEPPFEPLHLEGEWWVPFSTNIEPSVEEIVFPINATERRVRVSASLSETYAGVQVTGSTAEMTIRLIDSSGEAWQESREPLGSQNLHIETEDLPVGNATFRIEVRGGSDGSANGDRVAWTIDVT